MEAEAIGSRELQVFLVPRGGKWAIRGLTLVQLQANSVWFAWEDLWTATPSRYNPRLLLQRLQKAGSEEGKMCGSHWEQRNWSCHWCDDISGLCFRAWCCQTWGAQIHWVPCWGCCCPMHWYRLLPENWPKKSGGDKLWWMPFLCCEIFIETDVVGSSSCFWVISQ